MQAPHDYNPYQSPVSDISYEESDEYGLLDEPNRLTAGSGIEWITQAWSIFMARPLLWVVTGIVYLAVFMVLGALGGIPVLGFLFTVIMGVVTPMFMAGFCYIAHNIEYEQETGIGDLFVAFQDKLLDFIVLWFWQFLLTILLGFVMAFVMVIVAFGVGVSFGSLMSSDSVSGFIVILMVLIALALVVPLIMMAYFAPILILFHDLKAWAAMKLSFKACLRNMIPFLIYGIIALLMLFIGSIPVGLGLLVVFPLLAISIYTSYKQILTNSY